MMSMRTDRSSIKRRYIKSAMNAKEQETLKMIRGRISTIVSATTTIVSATTTIVSATTTIVSATTQ